MNELRCQRESHAAWVPFAVFDPQATRRDPVEGVRPVDARAT